MFVARADHEALEVVWLFTGAVNTDDDYQGYVDSIRALIPIVEAKGRPAAAMLVVDDGNPTPGAAWRRQIADVSRVVPRDVTFLLVTPSPLMRGVMTAINWMRSPTYDAKAVATVDDAIGYLRAKGFTPTRLPALLAEARAMASTRA